MRKLLAAVLVLSMVFVGQGTAHADHMWHGCPSGWDGEVGGYTGGRARTWVSWRIQVNGGHTEDRFMEFENPNPESWWGYSWGGTLDITSHAHRIVDLGVLVEGSGWHIATFRCNPERFGGGGGW